MNRDGLLLIDKPAGRTSAQVVRLVVKAFAGAKAGHAGTLDPAATGLLVVGVGDGTKVLHYLLGQSKRYAACVRLGVKTSTGDAAGEVVETRDHAPPDAARLHVLCERFTGELRQTPPMYSALKHEGKRLYELARRRQVVARAPRGVTIHALTLKDCSAAGFCFEVHCSKGTYIRVLAEDMGVALGTVAHLASLRRTASGEFTLDGAVDGALLEAGGVAPETLARRLLPVDAGLAHLPAARLDAAQTEAMRCGRKITHAHLPAGGLFRVYDAAGALLAVAVRAGETLHPKRVFHKPNA